MRNPLAASAQTRANPAPARPISNGEVYQLRGANSIATTTAGGKTYALVTSTVDDNLQIINITDPTNPSLIKSITDGDAGYEELDGARGLTTVEIGGSNYALIASSDDDGVQIINITDPENPSPFKGITDGVDGFNELDSARSISTTVIDGKTIAKSNFNLMPTWN